MLKGLIATNSRFYKNPKVPIIIIYLVINALILYFSDHTAHIMGDADAYFKNALAIINGQELAGLLRQPLYSFFLVPWLFIFGQQATWACVIGQFILSISIAWFGGKIGGKFNSKAENYVFGVILLNPLTIIHAHILITEIFYAFVFIICFFLLLKGIEKQKSNFIYLSALCFGALPLIRPEAVIFLYLSPFIIVYFTWVIKGLKEIKPKVLLQAVSVFVIAYTLTVPWQIYIYKKFEKINVSSGKKKFDHLSWNVAILENINLKGDNVKGVYYNTIIPEGKKALSSQQNYVQMSENEREAFLVTYYTQRLFRYSPIIYTEAFLRSWTMTFLGGGVQVLMRLLKLENTLPSHFIHKSNISYSIFSYLSHSFNFLMINSIIFGIIIMLKILFLMGVIALIIHRNYKVLLLTLPPIFIIIFIFLFDGQSRIRIPFEPFLMVYSFYGLTFIKQKLLFIRAKVLERNT